MWRFRSGLNNLPVWGHISNIFVHEFQDCLICLSPYMPIRYTLTTETSLPPSLSQASHGSFPCISSVSGGFPLLFPCSAPVCALLPALLFLGPVHCFFALSFLFCFAQWLLLPCLDECIASFRPCIACSVPSCFSSSFANSSSCWARLDSKLVSMSLCSLNNFSIS